MDRQRIRHLIAQRVIQEFRDGDLINLGIGIPTLAANYIPHEISVTFQSENGMVGLGPDPALENVDPEVSNAGGMPATICTGGVCFDSSQSFGMIRGGHVDITVLGALQVDRHGNLANWIVPGQLVPGIGGAMDLVTGARRVIVAMEHTAKGISKIVNKCTLPLTGAGVVDLIITEMCVMEVTPEGLVLTELHPAYTLSDLRKHTEAAFEVSPHLRPMEVEGKCIS